MPNGDLGPPNAVVQAPQGLKEPLSGIYKQNDTDMNQPPPLNPPETPTPPPGGILTSTRAPEHMALPERYQTALRRIQTLESHNARLYEDNCRLVNAVNTLSDRLAFVGAPQNTQALRLADMQEKLRASEGGRALINRKYQELLQSTSAGSAQRHFNEELKAIQDAYASLDREYRLLADKYGRLKVATQQQPQGTARGIVPVVRPEFANTAQFRAQDQNRNSYASPTSAISPGSFQPFVDQNGNHRRRSSESVMPPLRSGPTPIATNWLAYLPTPPPSASLSMGQGSPTGLPVHTSVPAGSLSIPHHPQIPHDPRTPSSLPAVTQSHHVVQQGASEQLNAAMHLYQRYGESTDTINKESIPCSKEISAPAALTSSPRPPKRPNSEPQASTSPGAEHKKPRIKGEPIRPTTIDIDTYPANNILSSPASNDTHDDPKSSELDSTVRSYEDCVNLIFEKDADVESGVFCGLCLDRYEAKMIPEPPDILVQPDFDLLVRHCMTEHPTVWDDLRRKA